MEKQTKLKIQEWDYHKSIWLYLMDEKEVKLKIIK